MRIGITGLPGSGKSTVFSVLTHIRETGGDKTKPRLGVVKIPEARIDELGKVFGSEKITHVEITLSDNPGFNPGSLGDMDAFICVVGTFYGKDPVKDARELETGLISEKPHLVISNIAETDIGKGSSGPLLDYCKKKGLEVIEFSAKTELDILDVPEGERQGLLKDMGVDMAARDKFIEAVHRLLKLVTFFTVKGKEARAWAIREGTSAVEAAGKIHTDMKKGFIRAEVVNYKDFMACEGKISEARNKGLLKLEGKEYVVKDGDILDIRFSV